MVRCECGLEAVIRTSQTNRNPGRRFYGCPTLSPTCVNFLRWYDPPMCQRSVQIIPGLLRSRNELEEILAMVEEKRRSLLDISPSSLEDEDIVEMTQREAQLKHMTSQLTEAEAVAYKTREHLKCIQKAVFVEVIELKKELRLQVPPLGVVLWVRDIVHP
ncbi:zinc finger, GRF-type containing protein [Tanacetum coccineum]